MVRVVASYTTIPGRYDELRASLLTLHSQTRPLDAIYLTLPRKAARLNKEYPPLPEDIVKMCTVVRCETDYGPLTKIYGALMSEKDPETIIMSCDDDVAFAKTHVEVLLKHQLEHPNSAVTGTGALIGKGLLFISLVSIVEPFNEWNNFFGFDVPPEGRKVDLIAGVAGVMYRRRFFHDKKHIVDKLFKYSLVNDAIFRNDDVLISGYLCKRGIERRVFLDIPTAHHASGADALSANLGKLFSSLSESIEKVKEYGFLVTTEDSNIEDTPVARGLISVIIIIVIIVLIVLLYKEL